MILEIPTDSILEDFKQTVSLEGVPYILSFEWSDRSQSWYISVYLQTDGDPEPIAEGLRLSVLWPLLIGCVHEDRPPGQLVVLDLNGQGDPGREDLGTRVKLYYFDEEALASA